MRVNLRLRLLAAGTIVAGVATGAPLLSAAAHTSAGKPTAYRIAEPITLRPKPPSWVLPATGYRLTGRFGDAGYLWSSVHTGLDFATGYGAPIRSVTAGVVTSAAHDGAYGYKTVVTLGDGTEVWYCHQSSLAASVGQALAPGQVIGYVGTTGNVTGAHLHLEVRPGGGEPVDPYTFLATHGVTA